MLRTASRRLSVLQPSQPPELPLAAQGGSSLLLLATLRGWSGCSQPLHTAAPSSAAAAAVGAAAALLAVVPTPSQQLCSSRSYSSSPRNVQWGSGSRRWQLRSAAADGSTTLQQPSAAAACLPLAVGRRSLHWSSAAGAAADEQQQQTAEVLRRAVRSLLPETAVVQYLQDRVSPAHLTCQMLVSCLVWLKQLPALFIF